MKYVFLRLIQGQQSCHGLHCYKLGAYLSKTGAFADLLWLPHPHGFAFIFRFFSLTRGKEEEAFVLKIGYVMSIIYLCSLLPQKKRVKWVTSIN